MKEGLFFFYFYLILFYQCPILLYRDRKSTSLHHYRQETRENPERFSLSRDVIHENERIVVDLRCGLPAGRNDCGCCIRRL